MDTNGGALQLTIDQDGAKFTRVYRNSDAKDGMIIIGRASATYPNPVVPVDDPVGGHVVEKGTVAFYCPVMSRTHARLVFGSEGSVYISDPPDHSHHGTFITRGEQNFKVGHPQRLETGDAITFGKPVHRGGDVYNPLTAVVRVLSGPTQNPGVRHATSFNGTSYTLPPDIDDQPPPLEEEELTSNPRGANEGLHSSKSDGAQADPVVEVNGGRHSNYQCFALDQGPSDMEDSSSEDSEIEELPAPPLADHNHRSSVVCPIPSTWEIPRPPRPSQAFIQSHQPTSPVVSQSEGPPASGMASSAHSSPIRPADTPWRLLYGHTSQNDLDANFPPSAGGGTPFAEWLSKFDAGLANHEGGTLERERDLDVAFTVLKEHRREVIDVDLEPELDAPHVSREVIDVDAFSTPEPPFAQHTVENSVPILKYPEIGVDRNDVVPDGADLPKTTTSGPPIVDTTANVTPVVDAPQARTTLICDFPSQDEDFAGGQEDESQVSDESLDKAPTDALSEAAEHFQEFRIINECIKELSEKVDRLEGSRHRTKRRFALQKAAFNDALVTIDDEITALKAGTAVEELKTFMQEMRGWKEELEKTLPRDDGTLGSKIEKVSKDLDAMQEVVREKELVSQEMQQVWKAAVEAVAPGVNGLHTAVDKVEESTASLKRKRDAREQEDDWEDCCSLAPSAPAIDLLCQTYTVCPDPEGNASVPVKPTSEVVAVPAAKRRRLAGTRSFARVATRLLVGGAIAYVGLGLI